MPAGALYPGGAIVFVWALGAVLSVQPQSMLVQAVLWERPLERGTRVAPS